eukprot:CAMPEP_0197241680 /NCGR_PEP_ID=MMETSP1429-20130617/7648_1 /TAXON_ID=49237 /ORGANISM="Chaetoceros  sp., Strain UNC1202" /LENGTH=112 /DNA_ID=CAMNT_0042701551 /DNA_START=595 /DNA_END=929 /DNA_ORIENTATION=+
MPFTLSSLLLSSGCSSCWWEFRFIIDVAFFIPVLSMDWAGFLLGLCRNADWFEPLESEDRVGESDILLLSTRGANSVPLRAMDSKAGVDADAVVLLFSDDVELALWWFPALT